MTGVHQWASRWQLHPHALNELMYLLGVDAPPERMVTPGLSSEAGVQQQVRILVAQRGGRVWRNNSGACEDKTGRLVRFGLGNDSAAVCEVFKTGDLVGITPLTVAPHHVGCRVGVFTMYECKKPGWVFRQSDKRAVAQLNAIKLVQSLGGIARFVSDPGEVVG